MPLDPKLIDIQFKPDGYLYSKDEETYGAEFPDSLIIRKQYWKDKIEELQQTDVSNSVHPKGCLVAAYLTKPAFVFDQTPESSCVANACCGAMMRAQAKAFGVDSVAILSPMSLYARICRSRHSGSYMMDALETSKKEGVLPANTHGQATMFAHAMHENTPWIRERQLPDGWEETAKLFRVTEWLRISSLEQFGSALLNQYPVVYGRSGHSIVGEDLVVDGRHFYCRSCDSYRYDNRDGTGRIFDSERMMSSSGAWACRVVTAPENLEVN